MSYDLYIFDFDYTLGDCTGGIIGSVNYATEKMGYGVFSEDAIRKTIGLTLEDTFFVLTGEPVSDENTAKAKEFHGLFVERADEIMTSSTEFLPGALETLHSIKEKGYLTAVVTTKYGRRISAILDKFSVPYLIDYIVGSDNVEKPKPDPMGVNSVLEQSGVSRHKTLYIGDSIVDAKTAQSADIDFAAVTTGSTTEEELSVFPHIKIMSDIREILEL